VKTIAKDNAKNNAKNDAKYDAFTGKALINLTFKPKTRSKIEHFKRLLKT
jgi:hypothetical protein